jgi:hypothetical protein
MKNSFYHKFNDFFIRALISKALMTYALGCYPMMSPFFEVLMGVSLGETSGSKITASEAVF